MNIFKRLVDIVKKNGRTWKDLLDLSQLLKGRDKKP